MQPSASPRPPSRRGPPLAVRTNSPPQNPPMNDHTPSQHRASTFALETAYSRQSEEETQGAVPAARRQSKLNFRLFARNKSTHRPETVLAAPEEEPACLSPELPDSEAPTSPDDSREASRERSSTGRVRSKKDKHRAATNSDPPSLYQAYPQSVKEGNLLAPVGDAETILRNRSRQSSEADESNSGLDAAEGSPNPETTKDVRKKINKRRTSTLATVPCATKLYILTTSGWLLQYANDGCYNRLPERIMQLRKDSAAFASDAIPGKHWVLQISQSSNGDGTVLDAPRPSVFSKLSFGHEMKKPVSAFLMVMHSAEEMNSWLVTIRKEIQSLGGLEYRPDERSMSNATSGSRPSSDPQSEGQRADQRQRALSQRASMYSLRSPPGSGLPPSSLPASRPELGNRTTSNGSMLSQRASMYALSPTSQSQPRKPSSTWQPLVVPTAAKRSPRESTFNLDKALPERPVDDTQARIDALGIINAEKLRRSQEDIALSPRSTTHPLQSPKSPKFPVSAYNPDARKFSMDSPRPSIDAFRHHRFSFEKSTAPAIAPPQPTSRPSHETMDSNRTRTSSSAAPSLTDGESAPQESLPGDVPTQDASHHMSFVDATPTNAAYGVDSQPQAVRIEVQQTPTTAKGLRTRTSCEEDGFASNTPRQLVLPASQGPKRYASFENPRTVGLYSNLALNAPPYPVPNTHLPPLPFDAHGLARPSSAQGAGQRSISPMPTGKGLRRPSSYQPPTPGRGPSPCPPTAHLPIGKPLTIQERRRLSHRPVVVGPPMLPPPTSPLPELPKTAANNVIAPMAPPTPPPFRETPPMLTATYFTQPSRSLPDSPPSTVQQQAS